MEESGRKTPEICGAFEPRRNEKNIGWLELIEVEKMDESDQDLGYSDVLKFTFFIPCKVIPSDRVVTKSYYAPTSDTRFHFLETKGDINELKKLIGHHFTAKMFLIWKRKLLGKEKETGLIFSETYSDWEIDLDTISYYRSK